MAIQNAAFKRGEEVIEKMVQSDIFSIEFILGAKTYRYTKFHENYFKNDGL